MKKLDYDAISEEIVQPADFHTNSLWIRRLKSIDLLAMIEVDLDILFQKFRNTISAFNF